MGVYKRGNVYWFIKHFKGRRYEGSLSTDNKRMAEELYAKALTAILRGEYDKPEMQNFTFGELAEKYSRWAEGRQRSWEKSRHYMVNQLVRYFGRYSLVKINTNLLEQYQTSELRRGLNAGGVNRSVGLFKSMFTKAHDWQMVSEDILKRVRKVKAIKGEIKRLRYLSKEECLSLINVCEPYLRPIVITALNTGMRKSEILNLKWEQVDLKHGFILLDNDTKNGERREIPINDALRATLQGIVRRLDSIYVFCNPATGKPYTKDLKRSFQTACRRAAIRDFRFHDQRHTFASHLVMAGVDITTVSKLLGHKSLTMTLRYSHLAPAHLKQAVQSLNYCNFTTVAGSEEFKKAVTP